MGHRTKVCISCTHWLCIVIFFRSETPRESKFLPLKFRSINLIKLRLGPIYCNNFNSVWKGTGFEMFPWQNHRILFFAFSDSDWAGCPLTRRSTTCFVTLARQQYYLLDISKTTCSCLFVYEYRALASSAAERTWLGFLVRDLHVKHFGVQCFIADWNTLNWIDTMLENVLQWRLFRHVSSISQLAGIFTKS